MRRITAFAGLCLLLQAETRTMAGEMTASEITSELVGRQIVWWQDGGWQTGQLMLLPDGAAELSLDRPERLGDVGRWALRGSELCTEWSQMRDGREKCYSIERGNDGRFVTSGGNVFELRETGV